MIAVTPTPKNWEIYSQLCEIDAEFRVCDDEQGKQDLIELANALCEELELGDLNGN